MLSLLQALFANRVTPRGFEFGVAGHFDQHYGRAEDVFLQQGMA